MTRECVCIQEKIHRVIFDGGSSGFYTVDLCENCYSKEDRKFLISEEKLLEVCLS